MKTALPGASRSFTLTEILTATAVLSVLFTIMFGILQQTSKGWQAANRRVEASQAVRLALDQICQDLENCVVVNRTNLLLPTTTNTPSEGGTTSAFSSTNYAFGFVHLDQPSPQPGRWLTQGSGSVLISSPNDCIFVVTTLSPSLGTGGGDLAEIGYVPVWVIGSATSPGYGNTPQGRYALIRSFAATNGLPLNDFLTNNAAWETTPGVQYQNNVENFSPIVDNCVGFNITFVGRTNVTQTFPTNSWPRVSATWPGLPLAADITLCVMDERTAARVFQIVGTRGLSTAEISNVVASVTNAGVWTNIQNPALRSALREGVLGFQRRVHFRGSAP